jgi:hypothetical protein
MDRAVLDPGILHVFFYGLLMDTAVLRAKRLAPGQARVVTVRDHALRLGAKAMLLHAPGENARGVLVELAR